MNNDPFLVKASKVFNEPNEVTIPLIPDLRNVFTSARRVFRTLAECDYVDAVTYTFNPRVASVIPLRKVICRTISGQEPTRKKVQVRYVGNVHAKFYIGYVNDKPSYCFVGSFNLVNPTLLEVGISCSKSQSLDLVQYFTYIWNKLKP